MGEGLNKHQGIDAKSYKKSTCVIVAIIVIAFLAGCIYIIQDTLLDKTGNNTTNTVPITLKESYRLDGNGISDFDLVFMQLENNGKNKVYSPLSIKYALEMLAEGTDGETKSQLDAVIGDYVARKYTNSNNMSFANAMFIKNTYKNSIKSTYVDNLQNKYYAEVIYDDFSSPKVMNDWVSNKTFKLIPNLIDGDVSDIDYALVNALAIDMEWQNVIHSLDDDYQFLLEHEKAVVTSDYDDGSYPKSSFDIKSLNWDGYKYINFNNNTDNTVAAVQIAAVANKYDIISELGEDNIRKIVQEAYAKHVTKNGEDESFNLDEYMTELKSNYKQIGSSTVFSFYDDDNVKTFAKDLKTYNGVSLQYIGIMPKQESLTSYIENLSAESVNFIVNNLKPITLDSFDDGYLTYIHGNIPLFSYDYELKLKDDLMALGIKDVYDPIKANLSKISSMESHVSNSIHKAKIDFANEGIKAAAATAHLAVYGMAGDLNTKFEYSFEIPIKEIDLTFDKPFIYIIRDKSTGEVWFTGSVYKPLEYSDSLTDYNL